MFSKYPLCPWTPEGAENIHFRRLSIYLQCTYLDDDYFKCFEPRTIKKAGMVKP